MKINDKDGELVGFFGYGSLVNELTWDRVYDPQPARIRNWRREWKHCVDTPFGRVCALTVSRQSESFLDGLLLLCSRESMLEIDEREIGYKRIKLELHDLESFNIGCRDAFIYVSKEACYRKGSHNYPIWQSYLDSVLYGYWNIFGQIWVEHFMSSTWGWSTPIVNDREQPLYPRATSIPVECCVYFDQIIEKTLAKK